MSDKIVMREFDPGAALEKLEIISHRANIPAVDVAFMFGVVMIEKYGDLAVSEVMTTAQVQKNYDDSLSMAGINGRWRKTICEYIAEKDRGEIEVKL